MPRRQFRADLSALQVDTGLRSIQNVSQAGDDNEFTFILTTLQSSKSIRVTALVLPDLADYPSSHAYQLFADDNTPVDVASALANLHIDSGLTLAELLQRVSQHFAGEDDILESREHSDGDFDADEYYCDEDFGFTDGLAHPAFTSLNRTAIQSDVARARMKADLIAAKKAGFKVGIDHMTDDRDKSCISLAIRVKKLGISNEAMRAWYVRPDDYLILAICYIGGYRSLEELLQSAHTSASDIAFRTGLSTTYKPTHDEVCKMWNETSAHVNQDGLLSDANAMEPSSLGWRATFISGPLNELFNERWLAIVQARTAGLGWAAAEKYDNDLQTNQKTVDQHCLQELYGSVMETTVAYPSIVTNDHYHGSQRDALHSGPLIAMQFLLRHFVRCTEFCLVCHCALDHSLQAIKPYICDKPLCLYQYMSLGFGPSIEHDILTQPMVVDLLISFCWKAASRHSLTTFPTGMSLKIPDIDVLRSTSARIATDDAGFKDNYTSLWRAQLDTKHWEVTFQDDQHRIRANDWIMIRTVKPVEPEKYQDKVFWRHHKVLQVLGRIVVIHSTAVQSCSDGPIKNKSDTGVSVVTFPAVEAIEVARYDCNFDEIHEAVRGDVLLALLNLLPSVQEMQEYLIRTKRPTLEDWSERMPNAVYGVLRWILASNRACIMQAESAELIPGLDSSWSQFRFAMGAPDKELRFVESVTKTRSRLQLSFPTLFAWHGSALQNWHGIIREGLHFDKTMNGRAYGDGVYFSPQFATSLGYCQDYGHANNLKIPPSAVGWPRSMLGIASAMSLNEVVNAPQEFVARTPHFVVNQLDWIQTRYMFVRCVVSQPPRDIKPVVDPIPQDPSVKPTGMNGMKLELPRSAMARVLRFEPSGEKTRQLHGPSTSLMRHSKRRRVEKINNNDEEHDDSVSIATLSEDRDFLAQTPEPAESDLVENAYKNHESKACASKDSKTDFVPGKLCHASLPRLPPPQSATPAAAKQLLQRFRALKKVQDSTAQAELGWYIDPQQFDDSSNFFQWIMELHSFDQSTLLAQDMRQKDVASIVIEFRFPPDFPFSPPFARVIRPRFVPFHQGGGGHVTLGGSLCMQLLTNDGWLATMDMQSVLTSIRQEIMDPDPRPARLDKGNKTDYGIGEAVEGYIRACTAHGWTVPAGFRENVVLMDS